MSAQRPSHNQRLHLLWIAVALVIIVVLTFGVIRMQETIHPSPKTTTSTSSVHSTPTESGTITTDPHGLLAKIVDSGSTNYPGYELAIYRDGSGKLTYQTTPGDWRSQRFTNKSFPAGTIDSSRLEQILTSVGDVSKIPDLHCVKSISFGTTTTILYHGKTSGDLTCHSGNEPQSSKDLKQFVHALYTVIFHR